jgi:parvulin-like peptidyl-prolyl isomerase
MKIISSFILTFFILSINTYSQTKEDIIAKVNGENVLRSELEKNKEEIMMNYLEINPDASSNPDFETQVTKDAFNKIVSEKLIKQEAEKQKIKVTEREIEEGINEVKSRFSIDRNGRKLTPEEREKFFMDELKKQGLTYEEFRSRIKKDLMARKLIEQTIKPTIKKPSEEEIKSFFSKVMEIVNSTSDIKANSKNEDYINIANKFKEIFGERIRLRHILIKFDNNDSISKSKALERAKSIRDRLLKGEDFEEVAVKESDDKESAKRGGDVGYVVKGMLPKNMEDVAFKLCPGEISDIIENDIGYHILQVSEKKIAEKIKYDLVKDDLENLIMQKNFADEVEKYVDLLKKNAKIEIYDSKLK